MKVFVTLLFLAPPLAVGGEACPVTCPAAKAELVKAERAVQDCKAKYYGEGWELWCGDQARALAQAREEKKRACTAGG